MAPRSDTTTTMPAMMCDGVSAMRRGDAAIVFQGARAEPRADARIGRRFTDASRVIGKSSSCDREIIPLHRSCTAAVAKNSAALAGHASCSPAVRMKWLVVALGAFGCLLPCARSRAAIDSSELPRVTLSQAVAYARERRPELRADRARVASVEAQAEVVRARWYPVVGATAQVLAATTNNTTSSYLPSLYFDNPRVSATRAESPSTMSLAPSGSSLVG